jgi:spermidine synthase
MSAFAPGDEPGYLVEALTPHYAYRIAHTGLLHDHVSRFQHIEVYQTEEFGRVLRLDGALQCSEKDEFFYHEPLVHLSLHSHPCPRRVLILGGGDGGAAEEALKYPLVDRVRMVEIDPEVVTAASRFLPSVSAGIFAMTDPRFVLTYDDGRSFLEGSDAVFDVILLDLTDPGGASAPLYEADFYRLCASRLDEQGILALHVASPWAHPNRIRENFRALEFAGLQARPFMTSVPVSGGPWVMALCRRPSTASWESFTHDLVGAPLRLYSEAMHHAMLVVPPYLQRLVRR